MLVLVNQLFLQLASIFAIKYVPTCLFSSILITASTRFTAAGKFNLFACKASDNGFVFDIMSAKISSIKMKESCLM